MATSGVYFARRKDGHVVTSAHYSTTRTGRSSRKLISVTVGGADCMTSRCVDESCVRRCAEKLRLYLRDIPQMRCCLSTTARHPGCFTHHAIRPRPDSIRLKRLQRYFLYAVFALLFLSGAAWAYWNYLVSSPGDFEMSAKAWAMKIHGAAAMAILVLIGMLLQRSCALRLARASESSQRVGFLARSVF